MSGGLDPDKEIQGATGDIKVPILDLLDFAIGKYNTPVRPDLIKGLWIDLEDSSAHGAGGISTGLEPLVQARRMVAVATGLAGRARKGLVRGMEDAVANRTGLHPFKALLNVLPPEQEAIKDVDGVRPEQRLARQDP